jgi:hypothetical protein
MHDGRASLNRYFNLENAVERAEGAALGGNVGAMARREEAAGCTLQRRQCLQGLCHWARSGVTYKLSVLVLTEFRIHKGFQRVQSGQLRFLGSS